LSLNYGQRLIQIYRFMYMTIRDNSLLYVREDFWPRLAKSTDLCIWQLGRNLYSLLFTYVSEYSFQYLAM
jgi:hypothetical protein